MRKPFIFFILPLIFIGSLKAQDKTEVNRVLQTVVPESEGMSSHRLGRIDSMLQEYVNKNWIPGASAIILKNGRIIYYKAIGYDNINEKTALKKNAIFRIASQTKAVTTVAIMMLYEQGKLSLDDSVSMYLPVFKNLKVLNKFNEADSTFTTVETKRPVTIRDLLTHTSGIGYPGIDGKEMNALYAKYGVISGIDPKLTLEDEMGKLAQVPLGFQPGEKWNYGLSVDVLGYLVESISGMRLDKFFKKYIFEPLGMKDTYFYLPEVKYDRLMELYDVDSKHHLVRVQKSEAFDPEYPKANGHYFSGGGGLSSTAYDYALFLQMLLNGGNLNGKRLLSQNTVRMMTTNQIGDLFCQGLFLGRDKFGLGFEIICPPDSLKFPIPSGSYGWGGTFGSLYWIDPVNKIVAQLVLQVVNPDNYREVRNKFVTLVYEALVK